MSTYSGHVKFTSVVPTIQAAAYGTADVIGGLMTFSNALPLETGCGLLRSVMIHDLAATATDLELHLFDSNPSGTTFTENSPIDIADADLTKVMAVIAIGSTHRFAYADSSIKYVTNLEIPVRGISTNAPSRTIYGVLVSRGTPTFASVADLTVTLGITFT